MCLVPNGAEEKVDRENKRGQNYIPVCCILCMCAQVNLSGPYRFVNPQLILPAPPCWLVSPHPPLPDEKIQVPGRGVVVPGGGRGVDRRPPPQFKSELQTFLDLKWKPLQEDVQLYAGSAMLCTPRACLTFWQPACSCVSGPPAGPCCCSRWLCCSCRRPGCCWPGSPGCCRARWDSSVTSAARFLPGDGIQMLPGPPRRSGF